MNEQEDDVIDGIRNILTFGAIVWMIIVWVVMMWLDR